MPEETQAYLVTIQLTLNRGRDFEAVSRLFASIDEANKYAAELTVTDLVCLALDSDIPLHYVDGASVVATEFRGSRAFEVHCCREWDYVDLAEFRHPPAEVLDGFVPSPV